VTSYNISGLAAAYAKRGVSPVERVGQALKRLKQLNPLQNAYFLFDRERALTQARDRESRRRQGAPLNSLDGTPTSLKDGLAAIGWPTHRDSVAHRDPKPATEDAHCIARLREAGTAALGKTTMPDFGVRASGYSSQHGVTRNPRNRRFNSCGSSSGTAAAVAEEIDVAAIGTDNLGSVRLPASFCGLLALIPSQDRARHYPLNDPVLAGVPLTCSVEDAAILMNLMSLPDARDVTAREYRPCDYAAALKPRPVAETRIGLLCQLGFGLPSSNEAISPLALAAALLQRAGCRVRKIEPWFDPADLAQAELYYKTRCFAEFAAPHAEKSQAATVMRDWPASVGMRAARKLFDAMSALRRMPERLHSVFTSTDFLVLPFVHIAPVAAELSAPHSESPIEPWANTFLFHLTEQPASAVRRDRERAAGGCWRVAAITVVEQLRGALENPARVDSIRR
jgi:aspartyl-tRNA(Asn)/glutamyl-tRNA(Gln) amidotransferase subunit A